MRCPDCGRELEPGATCTHVEAALAETIPPTQGAEDAAAFEDTGILEPTGMGAMEGARSAEEAVSPPKAARGFAASASVSKIPAIPGNCPGCQAPNAPGSVERPRLFCQSCQLYLPLLGGTFRLQKKLASGGFGAVYRGLNLHTGFPVAIKVLHQHLLGHRGGLAARFAREAEILQNNQHPHIVRTFDHGEAEGLGVYLVMEWLDGQTLSQRQSHLPKGRFSVEATCRVFAQFLDALRFIHEKGIVHRDLKPANLMLVEEHGVEVLKILDFGIAHLEDSQPLTSTGDSMGTPQFMAPEQIDGSPEQIGPATDLYSAGMLLGWMLTGKAPFQGPSLQELFYQHLEEPVPALGALCPEAHYSKGLEEAYAKACAKAPEARHASAEDFLEALRAAAPEAFERSSDEEEVPYKGLHFFDVEDAPHFFGRELLLDELLQRLAPGEARRFLGVLGASGSGKSSLVRAGLLARIQRGAFAESSAWPISIMRPSGAPIEKLAQALWDVTLGQAQSYSAFLEELRKHPRVLHDNSELLLAGESDAARRVLFIDQFEELFTLCDDEAQRLAFLEALHHAATVAHGRTLVLLTLRADFYGHCARYPSLNRLLSEHQVLLAPMSEAECKAAITQPAFRMGYRFEPGLVEVLLHEIKDKPASLPLLQHALLELWQSAKQSGLRVLSQNTYDGFGGVQGALQQRADAVYQALSPQQQKICRRIFLRLTQAGEGTEDTKRRVSIASLVPAQSEAQEVRAVLQKLAAPQARLVSLEGAGDSEELGMVEVSHEALIRGWQRLREWLDDHREALRIQDAVGRAAQAWSAAPSEAEATDYLFSGARLSRAEEWLQLHPEDANQRESDFIKASLALRDAKEAQERARIQREKALLQRTAEEIYQAQQAQSRAQSRLNISFAFGLGLLLVLGFVAFFARKYAGDAQRQKNAVYWAKQEANRAQLQAKTQKRKAERARQRAKAQQRRARKASQKARRLTAKAYRAQIRALAAQAHQIRLQKQLLQQSLHRNYDTLDYDGLGEVMSFFIGVFEIRSPIPQQALALRCIEHFMAKRKDLMDSLLLQPLIPHLRALLSQRGLPAQARCLAAKILFRTIKTLPRARGSMGLRGFLGDPQTCVRRRIAMSLWLHFPASSSNSLLIHLKRLAHESLVDRASMLDELRYRITLGARIQMPKEAKHLPILGILAQDPHVAHRQAVARALGSLGAAGLPLLRKLAKDPDKRVRASAAVVLATLGDEGLPWLRALARDEDAYVRAKVAFALGKQGSHGLPLLRLLAKDRSLWVRSEVASSLEKLGVEGLPLLRLLAKDSSPRVRSEVASSLEKLGVEGLSLLRRLAKDRHERVLLKVIHALGANGLPQLRRLATHGSTRVRAAVARTLGRLGPHSELSALRSLAADPHSKVQREAIRALAKAGVKGLPVLQSLAKDPALRAKVAGVLGLVGVEALPLLQSLAKDESESVRQSVAEALAELGVKGLPLLRRLAKDTSKFVRSSVAIALAFAGAGGLPLLRELAKDDLYVRLNAALSLGKLGVRALPVMRQLAKSDRYTRSYLATGLAKQGIHGFALLRALAKDPDSVVRKRAQRSIALLLSRLGPGHYRMLRALSFGAYGLGYNIRSSAQRRRLSLARRDLKFAIRTGYSSPSYRIRRATHLSLLRKEGIRRDLGAELLALFKASSSPQILARAAYYLGLRCEDRAIKALVRGLARRGKARDHIALALARLRFAHPEAAKALQQAAGSKDAKLRHRVAWALKHTPPAKACPKTPR